MSRPLVLFDMEDAMSMFMLYAHIRIASGRRAEILTDARLPMRIARFRNTDDAQYHIYVYAYSNEEWGGEL